MGEEGGWRKVGKFLSLLLLLLQEMRQVGKEESHITTPTLNKISLCH